MSYGTANVDVLFYAERSLHLAYLEPVHDVFQRLHPDLRLAFCAPDYEAPQEDRPGWGLETETVERLQKKSLFLPDSVTNRPRVSVVADACYYNLPRQGKVVNVGHALTCKGMYYRRDPVVRRENLADLLCVPGPWHKRRLQENVLSPIRVTGFIKTDALLRPDADGKAAFCAKHGLDPNRQIILFAPTFNPEISAIPHVWDQVTTLGDDRTVIGIKLHHMTPKPWQEMYQRLAARRGDVIFLEDEDYAGMMHAADVMVSDASSMFVEFMLLNKPVVLFNSPQLESFENYHPDDIEHQVRDAVLEAESLPTLQKKVDKALEQPDILEEQRLQYIEELDYGRDGKSSLRAAEAVHELLRRPRKAWTRPRYSVIVELNSSVTADQEVVAEVVAKSDDLPMEVLPVERHGRQMASRVHGSMQGISQACAAAQGEWVVLLQPGWVLPHNWLKWMENHFHWRRQVGMVKALWEIGQVQRVYSLLFNGRPFENDHENLVWEFRNFGIGSAAYNDRIPSPCLMLPKSIAVSVIEQLNHDLRVADVSRVLEDMMIRAGYASATSLETYVYLAAGKGQ